MSNSIHLPVQPVFRSLVAPTLFGQLSGAVRASLLSKASIMRFSDGQIIQHKGDEPGGFWVIGSGVVKVGQFRLNGEFRTIALLTAGDSYGELAMFAGTPRAVDSVAEGAVTLRWIDAQAFEAAMAADVTAMRTLITALAMQLQEMIDLVAGLGSGTSLTRIAAVLANLASSDPANATLALGQQDLAELTGLTRATVNKALAQLERQGALIRHYGRIEITQRDILAALAAG